MSGVALAGLRVLEIGHQIAAPYCTKLLADLGADVIKVERPEGDPLRAWGPFPGDLPHPDRSGLFRYLNANKRSVCLDLRAAEDARRALQLASAADLVVENLRPGALESLRLGPDELRRANRRISLVRISSYGQTGPYRDLPATDLVLQAAGGWIAAYDALGAEPVRVGGRMPEFVAGAFAAGAALSAVLAAQRRDEPVEVDLSILECLVGTLPYPMVAAEALRAAPRPTAPARYVPFGIQRCRDGWVGINILTQEHWADACRVIGAPEFANSRGEVSGNEVDYRAFREKLRAWLSRHDAEQILEQCQAMRIPGAIVGTGQALLESGQLQARSFFVPEPGGTFEQPGLPYRLSRTPATVREPAPDLDRSRSTDPHWHARDAAPIAIHDSDGADLPLRGVRMLDLGTFWAGPYLGMYFASLGADVVKLESIQRPDGFRFIAPVDISEDDWYEAGALFQATNLGKRDVTLDLGREEGRALLLRLVERADVVLENFAPRVMERFDLDYEGLRRVRPDVIAVRMPAFGLKGPWRDYVGWGMAIAQAAGVSWITGNPAEELPRNPGGFIDPSVAMHGAVAIQAALVHRRRTGEGQQIEMAQLETAACMCPEPVIDYSLNGRVQARTGNRSHRCAPEGLYPCHDGTFVALSVRDDTDWERLAEVVGRPDWARDPALASSAGRLERRDELDRRLREWAAPLEADALVGQLRDAGLPAAAVLVPTRMYREPQLEARDYYQTLDHPVSGKRRYPGWPMRFSFAPRELHPGPAPTLGQHNQEVLGGELGLSAGELDRLAREGVIGQRWSV